MENKKLFEKIYTRLMWEAILKSLFSALIAGFSVAFIISFAFWFASVNALWVPIMVALLLTTAMVPMFYFWMYRPTTKSIAKRIDKLGFEERVITMTEFASDESYIAMKQREDATNVIRKVRANQIKFIFSRAIIAASSAVAAVGITMITLEGFADANIIKSGVEIIEEQQYAALPSYTIEYEVYKEMGGEVVGQIVQVVKKGEDGEAVMAVADLADEEANWVFVGWLIDGEEEFDSTDPERVETNVQSDVKVYAVFADADAENGEGAGEGEGEGAGEGEGEGEGKGNGDAEGEDVPGEGEWEAGYGEGEIFGDAYDSSGKWDDSNKTIDGKTSYFDALKDSYRNDGMDRINSDEIPDYMKDIMKDYYHAIG